MDDSFAAWFFGLLFLYLILAGVVFTANIFNGIPLVPVNWECTKSIVISTKLPREETCVEWSKKSNDSKGDL